MVGPSPDGRRGILSTILHADGRHAKALYTAAPGSALGRKEHVTTRTFDACRVHFRMDGKAVFQNGVEKMSEAVFECLRANGLTLDESTCWCRTRPTSACWRRSSSAWAFRGRRST